MGPSERAGGSLLLPPILEIAVSSSIVSMDLELDILHINILFLYLSTHYQAVWTTSLGTADFHHDKHNEQRV